MEMIKTPVNGMKDILPNEMQLRQYLLSKLREVYSKFGFMEIETPNIEHIENLLSNQGWDNEKLIFKILKRGDKLIKALENNDSNDLIDCGLRYDLTLPLCRFYSNNKDKLLKPFKAMQFGNVYRADRPQKGRFRQFMQCDIDILGDSSNLSEIELLLATSTFLNEIGFDKYNFRFEINDRRILKSMILYCGFNENDIETVCISIDKLDKIPLDKIIEEIKNNTNNDNAVDKINQLLNNIINIDNKNVTESINILNEYVANSIDKEVINNLINIIDVCSKNNNVRFIFNPTLVRGMGYYTGTIFEIKADGFNGSVGGGGRYDEMVSKFIGENVPSCGISIGFERIIGILTDDNYNFSNDNKKIAYLIDKDVDKNKIENIINEAMKERKNGNTVYITDMAKNKRFQKENLVNNGFNDIKEFYND